jgi:hypothetical protein
MNKNEFLFTTNSLRYAGVSVVKIDFLKRLICKKLNKNKTKLK